MFCSFKCLIHYFSSNKKVCKSLPSHVFPIEGYALCMFSDQGEVLFVEKKKKEKKSDFIYLLS